MTIYAIVDLEATKDNVTNQQHIIQIGITFIENDAISDTLTIDIKPPVAISQTITDLTGITNHQVADAPTFEDVSEYILTVLDGCVFVAHNSVFDYGLLVTEYERLNQVFPKMVCIDTIELAKILMPTQTLFGLKTLTHFYGIALEQHHNAGEDSHATALLFLTLKQEIEHLSRETCDKIYRLLQQKKDDLFCLFENTGRLMNTRPIIFDDETVSNKQKTFIIVDDLATVETMYVSYREFVDESILNYLVCHGQELSMQESRLLAKVCVYLEKSNGAHLLPLRLPRKFMQRIQSHDTLNRYYLNYLSHLKQQEIIYFTVFDFITDYDLLRIYFDFSKIELQIMSIQNWIKQSRSALTQVFPLTNWVNYLFSLKKEKVITNQSTAAIDNIISQLFRLLDGVREEIRLSQVDNVLKKDREYYLGAIKSEWVTHLVEILRNIERILDRPYKTNYLQLLERLERQITFLDYASIQIQVNDFTMRYTLNFYPFSTQFWFDNVVMIEFKEVHFVDTWINHKLLSTYFEVMVSQHAEILFKSYDDLPDLYVQMDKNAQLWKENLIVKKVVQFCKVSVEKTVIIVPNQTILAAVKDSGITIIEDSSQGCLIDKHDVVVATFKTAYAMRSQLQKVQKICLVKLPFEHPDSMQHQASKSHLPVRVTYFSNIDLIAVLLDIWLILIHVSNETRIEIWDNRLIQSSYAQKITDILNGIVKIVEE